MTGKKPSSPTELKVADALAERLAWDEGSEVSEGDLWALVQPRLPRADAGRAYADRNRKKADGLTEAERIAAGQRMFFDKALEVMEKRGQLGRSDSAVRLGPEPLWRRVGEREPLEIYVPGWHGLKDAEARKRASDRKLLNAILKRKAFEVRPDSENYQALRTSFGRYGVRPEHPIIIDDSTDPPFVLDGRTRLAVARELGLEEELLKYAHRVKADSSFALNELILGNLHRRQLTSKEIRDVRAMVEEGDGNLEAAELKRIEAAFQETEDRLQRNLGEKNERIRAALTEDASRSNRLIAELIGTSDPTVGKVRDELMLKLSIHRYEFPKGGNSRIGKHSAACWCGEGDAEPKPNRKISDEQIEEIIAHDLPWPEIVSRFGVGQSAAQSAKTRAMERKASRAPRPAAQSYPQPTPQAAEGAWSKIMGRIGRIASLWQDAPPAPAVELAELEALRSEIDERITALRG